MFESNNPGAGRSARHTRVFAINTLVWIFVLLNLSCAFYAIGAEEQGQAVPDQTSVILVLGAAGDTEFGSNFLHQAAHWSEACAKVNLKPIWVGTSNVTFSGAITNDLTLLKEIISLQPTNGFSPLWIVLIGHGTFDGKEAKFNLRGPDLTASDLVQWLQPFERPLVIINNAPASAPFLNKLSRTNRIIISATRSGNELNFTRFGNYLAESIQSADCDLDKDGQTSILEAFLMAARKTAEFYKVQGRILTEHALIDDNGDGLGTPADWFHGVRAVKKPKDKNAVDGLIAQQKALIPNPMESSWTAQQRAQRDALERAVIRLREQKTTIPEKDYYVQLEKLLIPLAEFYR